MTSNSLIILPLNIVTKYDQRPVVRALYSYLASGENQLTFHEHDRIALVGDRAKGWQFGENLRTQLFGWFPIAYTEIEQEDTQSSNWGSVQNGHHNVHLHAQQMHQQHLRHIHHNQQHPNHGDRTPDSSLDSTLIEEDEESSIPSKMQSYQDDHSPARMFGDTIMYRQSKQYRRISNTGNGNEMINGGSSVPKPGPPPTLPAPVPTPTVPSSYANSKITQSHSFSSNGGPPMIENRKSMPATMNFSKQVIRYALNQILIFLVFIP